MSTLGGSMLGQLKNVLKSLKWTDSQASAYCVLVERGAMSPSDLAIHSDIAQGKVYAVLDDLERNKGAVVKEGKRPTMYKAQHPRYVLTYQIERIVEMKDQALEEAEGAYEGQYERTDREAVCWSVQGISGVQIQLRRLLGECKKSLKVSDSDLGWVSTAMREFAKGGAKVEIEILGPPAQASRLETLRRNGAAVRTCSSPRRCCIVDDKVAMVRFTGPDSAIVVRDSSFVAGRIDEFNGEFGNGDELGGLEVAR